jgi:uncharacterized membrane protein YpjA
MQMKVHKNKTNKQRRHFHKKYKYKVWHIKIKTPWILINSVISKNKVRCILPCKMFTIL